MGDIDLETGWDIKRCDLDIGVLTEGAAIVQQKQENRFPTPNQSDLRKYFIDQEDRGLFYTAVAYLLGKEEFNLSLYRVNDQYYLCSSPKEDHEEALLEGLKEHYRSKGEISMISYEAVLPFGEIYKSYRLISRDKGVYERQADYMEGQIVSIGKFIEDEQKEHKKKGDMIGKKIISKDCPANTYVIRRL